MNCTQEKCGWRLKRWEEIEIYLAIKHGKVTQLLKSRHNYKNFRIFLQDNKVTILRPKPKNQSWVNTDRNEKQINFNKCQGSLLCIRINNSNHKMNEHSSALKKRWNHETARDVLVMMNLSSVVNEYFYMTNQGMEEVLKLISLEDQRDRSDHNDHIPGPGQVSTEDHPLDEPGTLLRRQDRLRGGVLGSSVSSMSSWRWQLSSEWFKGGNERIVGAEVKWLALQRDRSAFNSCSGSTAGRGALPGGAMGRRLAHARASALSSSTSRTSPCG